MSHAVATFGRFNAPTEKGHGKLIAAVQQHAEDIGAKHYIFPSHTQDPKKNPLAHGEKVGFMRRLFPTANIVSSKGIRNVIDAMKHLESKGHKEVTMIVGSDRVGEFKSLLNKYRTKEFPNIKKVNVKSAGQRDPDAEGAEGESASKHRALVAAGKRDEFINKYSDKKLGADIHDALKKGMQMESTNPIGIFLLGGPGSGKDYVLKNIFSRFDLVEVQIDQVLNGKAAELIESNQNIVINGAADAEKIELVKNILEGYTFDTVYVSVSNKVSRVRNEEREDPLPENKRLEKWYRAEKLAEELDCFVFNNSINLNESSQLEQIMFGGQIEKLLERLVANGLVLSEKTFPPVAKDKESGLPKKYVSGLSKSTALARKAHWKKMSKLSDKDPRAYEPAPGDKTAETKPSKHTLAVRKMMDEAEQDKVRRLPRSGNITAVMAKRKETGRVAEETIDEGAADKSLSAKAAKSGVSLSTLKKVYRRGVAAWNSGHRPGTTPSQWGHARVNSYINKGKTYHTADKDLREAAKVEGTNCKNCIYWCKESEKPVDKSELNENGGLKAPNDGYLEMAKHVDLVTLPGKATVKIKAFCEHEDVKDFVTERMCCAYWNGEGTKREYKGLADFMEENEINSAVQEINNDFEVIAEVNSKEEEICCPEESIGEAAGADSKSVIDATPTLDTTSKKKKSQVVPPRSRDAALDGLPVVTTGAYVREGAKPLKSFMKTPRQVPAPPGGHPVPPGYERVKSWGGAYELRKIKEKPATVKEAVEYHIENQISFTDNIFRPGSEMFFEMIGEAKKLYKEGKYTPADEFELDMLNSDIGEKVMFEGQEVLLDYPFEEEINEEDKTDGKGIGKPWREGGGGAVYVRTGDGGVKKVRFSQSGMKKKFMDPAATRSFVARHHCLTNKDKTSASYWACRYPRFFSNSGKTWW